MRIPNPVAERLPGWNLDEAMDRSLDDIFQSIDQETRELAVAPVMEPLARGTIQGLANQTMIMAREGTARAIADSFAPIRGLDLIMACALGFASILWFEAFKAVQRYRQARERTA